MSKIGNAWTDSRRTHPSWAPTTLLGSTLQTKLSPKSRDWSYHMLLTTRFGLSEQDLSTVQYRDLALWRSVNRHSKVRIWKGPF